TRDNLLFLQRAIGNRSVAQRLQRKGKLNGDAQPEREEEPIHSSSTGECSCGTGQPCDKCGAPMRKAIRNRAPVLSPVSVTGSGMPIPAPLAADFGVRLGHRVDDVVIHADGAAAAAARSLNAEAFTVENHIYFGEGRWAPHTA